MFIQIEPNAEIPIYTQLENQLIKAIALGHLKSGDSLPSVRSLAADLGMNMHTVNKSYHGLVNKGIIQIIPKSGAVVNEISKDGISTENRERIEEALYPIIAEATVHGMTNDEIHDLTMSILLGIKGGL